MDVPTRAALDALRAYDTPTLTNAMDAVVDRPYNTGYTRPPVHCVLPSLPAMLGFAVTATIRSEAPWASVARKEEAIAALYAAIHDAPGPRIVVVQDLDAGSGCLWGEVNASICRALDCEGVVTDGLVRDLPEVEAIGFRYLARGVGVSHAYVEVVDTQIEVTVGGAIIKPGDVIHADRHGALVIPPDAVERLPAAAEDVIQREQRLISWARSGDFNPLELMQRRVVH